MYRVLLLDDEPMALKTCRHALAWEQFGMEVSIEETSAERALQKLNTMHIDIAFVDLHMPGMDGFQFIDTLAIEHPDIICVILTGFQDYEYVRKAFKAKVFDYCLKPIRSRENHLLLPDLEKAVSTRRIEKDKKLLDLGPNHFEEQMLNRLNLSNSYFLAYATLNMPKDERDVVQQTSHQRMQLLSSIPAPHLQVSSNEFHFFIDKNIDIHGPHFFGLQERFIQTLCITEDKQEHEMLMTLWPSWQRICTQRSHGYHLISDQALLAEKDDKIHHILFYIHEHYKEQISLRDVSDHFNINYAYCSELFSRHMRVSFSTYINQLKLKRACELLVESEKSIQSIAIEVGYSSEQYFSRIFKDQLKMTPSQYRREEGQGQ